MNQQPEDDELRLMLVQHLIQWGLFHLASMLAAPLVTTLESRGAEIADLITRLTAMRVDGRLCPDATGRQFESNLAAARGCHAWASEVEAAWRTTPLELHQTREGNPLAFDASAGAVGCWMPAFGRLRAMQTVDEIRAKVERRVVSPIAFDGVGLGSQVGVFHEATQDTMLGASPLLYVVEASWLALAAAMHACDWREILADRRVVWCVGPQANEQFEQAIRERPTAPVPQNILLSPLWPGGAPSRVRDIVGEQQALFESDVNGLRSTLAARYQARDISWWADRFRSALSGRGPALRVLAQTSRFTTVLQYSTRDAMQALAEIGCETRTLIEADDHSFVSPRESLGTIRDFDPDLILLVDHTRRSQSANFCEGIPFVTWVQDRLGWLFDRESGRAMGPLDFCMGQSAGELTSRFGYPADRFFSCEMATHAASLARRPDRPDPAEFACDLAYATHASEPPALFHQLTRQRAQSPPESKWMDAVYESMLTLSQRGMLNGSLHFDVFADRIALQLGFTIDATLRGRLVAEYVRPLADRFLRHQTAEWAANWARRNGGTFHLYGNGWDRLEQFAPFARGPLAHGWQLGAAFRSAKVNLHAGCNPALHQRVLDGLAAGGFFLIRKHGADVSHRVARALFDWMASHNPEFPINISSSDLPPGIRSEFLELRRFNGYGPDEPMILTRLVFDHFQRLFVTNEVQLAGQVWPEIDRIVFATEEDFASRIDHYLKNEAEREAIAGSMRRVALDRYSYESLMQRLLVWMADRLEEQSRSRKEVGRSNAAPAELMMTT